MSPIELSWTAKKSRISVQLNLKLRSWKKYLQDLHVKYNQAVRTVGECSCIRNSSTPSTVGEIQVPDCWIKITEKINNSKQIIYVSFFFRETRCKAEKGHKVHYKKTPNSILHYRCSTFELYNPTKCSLLFSYLWKFENIEFHPINFLITSGSGKEEVFYIRTVLDIAHI